MPESVVLPGTLPGDLKIALWDGTRWVLVPSSTSIDAQGSFQVTATTEQLGAFAVVYAPGAGRIQNFSGFASDGFRFGTFTGGGVDALEQAARLNGATGVFVRDADGMFRYLPVGGPRFVMERFADAFDGSLGADTPVILVRWTPASTTGSATASISNTLGDTLSRLGARFGVDWRRLAQANGISVPDALGSDRVVRALPR